MYLCLHEGQFSGKDHRNQVYPVINKIFTDILLTEFTWMLLALKIMLSQKIFSCLLPMNIASKVSFISKFPIRNVKRFFSRFIFLQFCNEGKNENCPREQSGLFVLWGKPSYYYNPIWFSALCTYRKNRDLGEVTQRLPFSLQVLEISHNHNMLQFVVMKVTSSQRHH